MPEPTDELTVKLSIAEWNTILQTLGDGSYKTVAPLINKINVQANEQLSTAAPVPVVANGADAEQPAVPP